MEALASHKTIKGGRAKLPSHSYQCWEILGTIPSPHSRTRGPERGSDFPKVKKQTNGRTSVGGRCPSHPNSPPLPIYKLSHPCLSLFPQDDLDELPGQPLTLASLLHQSSSQMPLSFSRAFWKSVKVLRAGAGSHTLETLGCFRQNPINWPIWPKSHHCCCHRNLKGFLVQRASCGFLGR